jgi:hypothetical protein
MAESFRFSVGAIRNGDSVKRLSSRHKNITIREALETIGNLPLSDEQKATLSSIAKKTPGGSLHRLVTNYGDYLKKP